MIPTKRELYALFLVYPTVIRSFISATFINFFLYSFERNSQTIMILYESKLFKVSLSPNGKTYISPYGILS